MNGIEDAGKNDFTPEERNNPMTFYGIVFDSRKIMGCLMNVVYVLDSFSSVCYSFSQPTSTHTHTYNGYNSYEVDTSNFTQCFMAATITTTTTSSRALIGSLANFFFPVFPLSKRSSARASAGFFWCFYSPSIVCVLLRFIEWIIIHYMYERFFSSSPSCCCRCCFCFSSELTCFSISLEFSILFICNL